MTLSGVTIVSSACIPTQFCLKFCVLACSSLYNIILCVNNGYSLNSYFLLQVEVNFNEYLVTSKLAEEAKVGMEGLYGMYLAGCIVPHSLLSTCGRKHVLNSKDVPNNESVLNRYIFIGYHLYLR